MYERHENYNSFIVNPQVIEKYKLVIFRGNIKIINWGSIRI